MPFLSEKYKNFNIRKYFSLFQQKTGALKGLKDFESQNDCILKFMVTFFGKTAYFLLFIQRNDFFLIGSDSGFYGAERGFFLQKTRNRYIIKNKLFT